MRTNRVLIIGLAVSLAINLVLVGVFLGRAAGPRPEMHRVDPVFGMRRLISGLPEDRAQALAPLYRDYFSAVRPRFREIRSTQQALRAAMLTDPLDEAALLEGLETFQAQLTDSQRAAQKAFVALAAELTLDERRTLVENMDRRPERRPGAPPYHHIRPEPPPR
jgi:uncharacterized membrane protein